MITIIKRKKGGIIYRYGVGFKTLAYGLMGLSMASLLIAGTLLASIEVPQGSGMVRYVEAME